MARISSTEYEVYRRVVAQTDLFLFDNPGATYSRHTEGCPYDVLSELESFVGPGKLAFEDFCRENQVPGELDAGQLPELQIVENGSFVLSRVGFSDDSMIALVHVHCHVAGYFITFRLLDAVWDRVAFHGSFVV